VKEKSLAMPIKFSEFDASRYLDTEEVIAEYLMAALEDENPEVFRAAVGHVAKARDKKALKLPHL
jgi:probable addiction module antidote protein